jgi:hypothetical protein
MKSHNMHKLIPLAFIVLLTLLLSACVTASGTQTAAEEPVAAAPEESVEPWDGDGMDIPLDGSSVEAFDKSLARVKVYASPANYTTLVNAIDYLMVYDLAAKRDKAKLVSHLDGLTGHQVVDRVAWRQ